MGRVHVEEEALIQLGNGFGTAGENYKTNYSRLTSLMDEITSGHIQGDVADELLNKYEAKKDFFEKTAKIIDDYQKYMSSRTNQFVNDMDSLMNRMS